MAYEELKQSLRQRVPHALLLGFVMGAMDELRILPQDQEESTLIGMLGHAGLIFFNATLIALTLVVSITLAERTHFARVQRVLALSIVVVVASVAAAALAMFAQYTADVVSPINHLELQGLFFHMLWISLAIGFLAASYFTVWERARSSAARVRTAELERQGIEQQVIQSRLNVMKARVEPEFLFRSIGEIQRLYRGNIESAENRLEDLIAYLRAALPQMRGGASTLGDELYLASTYLRLHDEAFEGRLIWSLEIDDDLDASHFPPMALLPLVDDALRRGASLEPPSLILAVRATRSGSRLVVTVEDDCAVTRLAADGEIALIAQERAFAEFFGGGATVRRASRAASGTAIILEAEHDIGAGGNR
jgi:sensor histidine kinase YesM